MRSHIYTKAYIGIALSLTGCMGVYEGGFECPPGEGVGCKSISEVNDMVNQCPLQYSVFSGRCSECKIPGLRNHDSEVRSSGNSEGFKLSDSCSPSLDIWYAPSAAYSFQYSVSSSTGLSPESLPSTGSEDKIQKDSLQNIDPPAAKTREFKGN